MDYDRIASELLRALRGSMTQESWSRAMGAQSNVAYAWEAGLQYPTGARTFEAAALAGLVPAEVVVRFYGTRPPWLDRLDPATRGGVAAMLDDLRGSISVAALARRAGLSRSSVSRLLSGRTEPRLPDFLRLIQAASLRAPDFVACLVDPADLPSLARTWSELEARRQGAFTHPWTQAVLRGLELADYSALPRHRPGWLAARLGIPEHVEETCLGYLRKSGQVRWTGRHWAARADAVDTRRHPEIGRHLKSHWTSVAEDRIEAGAAGQVDTVVFAVSQADYERIRELHLSYYRRMRAIVADSTPGELVVVANVQLFPLDRR